MLSSLFSVHLPLLLAVDSSLCVLMTLVTSLSRLFTTSVDLHFVPSMSESCQPLPIRSTQIVFMPTAVALTKSKGFRDTTHIC